MTAFEEFGVLPELAKAVDDLGWTLPTDIQSESVPLILGGGDVLMAAETGSGKTAAFCLPIIQVLYESLRDMESKCPSKSSTSSSSTSPTSSWLLSTVDRGECVALDPSKLRLQSRHQKEWHGVRATKGVREKGLYYYEAKVEDEGLCRVGFSTAEASLDLGTCRYGYGFGGTGKKSNNRQFDNYGESFGKNDIIGCYLDLDSKQVAFTKNGHDLGLAFDIDRNQHNQTFYPAIVLKNAEMSVNFGSSPFRHDPLMGFKGFVEARAECVVDNPKDSKQVVARKRVNNAPQAIIIEPSRELADQTLRQIELFKKHLPPPAINELLVVGGVPQKNQISKLRSGVDLVVATPGRLDDLIASKELSLQQVRFFVLDEADGLLKAGYEQMIHRLHNSMPKMTTDGTRLQMIVCSATLHDFEVRKLAERLMHFPTWVDLKGQDSVPDTVHHVLLRIDVNKMNVDSNVASNFETDGVHARDNINNRSKEAYSEKLKRLKAQYALKAIRKHNMDHAMIFCRTKVDCDNMERFLANNGLKCVCLHGDRKPEERKANLQAFKDRRASFLICTDVAARGLDVKGLPFLINVNLPDEKANYVHRIGRVGRADRMGLAISLVATHPEKVWYHGQWCPSRGRNCFNTRLTSERGCCIWQEDLLLLADIEEHLGVTVPEIGEDMSVAANEFDGVVVYGQKRKEQSSKYAGHVKELAPALERLRALEKEAQLIFWQNCG